MSEKINAIVARFSGQPGPLLLVLHAIQDELGFIPADAVPLIAAGRNL
jgi:NADH:ubiquinone oxidoreductase subunit E